MCWVHLTFFFFILLSCHLSFSHISSEHTIIISKDKLIKEENRSAGLLQEVDGSNSPKFLTFKKFEQGYYNDETIRIEDIQIIWNATGSEELWANNMKSKAVQRKMDLLKKREGWAGVSTTIPLPPDLVTLRRNGSDMLPSMRKK